MTAPAFMALLQVISATPATRCAAHAVLGAFEAFVVATPINTTDSTIEAVVCVGTRPGALTPQIGSYHGELLFNPAHVAVLRVERLPGGLRVENALAGRVAFAGASPSGMGPGPLLLVALRVRGDPELALRMLEMNGRSGTDLRPSLRIANPPRCDRDRVAGSPPVLTTIAPATVLISRLQAGGLLTIDVTGCGFDAARNAIRFGVMPLPAVPSDSGGTHLRFILPSHIPSRGEVPPQQILPGAYGIVVVTPHGATDPLLFTIEVP